MKKHIGGIAPQRVIEIIEESKEKATDLKNSCYHIKAAMVLGVIQIICGIIALAIWIIGPHGNDSIFSFGIWTFTLFFFSGVLTIRAKESRNRWLIAASMLMSISSAGVSAGFLLIKAGISHGFSDSFGFNYGCNSSIGNFSDENNNYGGISNYSNQRYNYRCVADVVKMVIAWTMLIACTASVLDLLTAFTHLSPSEKSNLRDSGRLVDFNSSQLDLTNHEDLHISCVQLNSSVNLANLQDFPAEQPSLDEPPTYQEVAGVRENC